jgi:mono/diheme cytochrome c family protein
MMKKTLVLFFALLATMAGIALAADVKAGEDAFNKNCKTCHGDKGATPNAAVSKMFGVPIPVLGSKEIQAKSDADLKTVITTGKGKMPAAKNVTGSAVDDVIAYVRTLKQ